MKKIRLKPSKSDLKVFNPKSSRDLDPKGELVSLSIYWRRRLLSGEVVEVKAEKPKPKAKEKIEKPKKTNINNEKDSEE